MVGVTVLVGVLVGVSVLVGAGLTGVLHALQRRGCPRARQRQEVVAHVGRLMVAVDAAHLLEDHAEAVVAHQQR